MSKNGFVSQWDFHNKHVDSSIAKENFMSAARSIFYTAPYRSNEEGTESFHRVGVIQGYNWGEQRQIELVFELGSDVPYLIPGRTIGQISISRLLIYGKDFVNLMYYEGDVPDSSQYIRSLKDIIKPLDCMFASYDNGDQQKVYSRVFTGCWLESRSESINSSQIIIAESVSMRYEDVIGVSMPR